MKGAEMKTLAENCADCGKPLVKAENVIVDRDDPPLRCCSCFKINKLETALREIISQFDEINGMECTRGCGRCARCIAKTALGIKEGEQ